MFFLFDYGFTMHYRLTSINSAAQLRASIVQMFHHCSIESSIPDMSITEASHLNMFHINTVIPHSHAAHGIVLLCEIVHVFCKLPMYVFWENSNIWKEGSEDPEFFLKEFNFFLEPLIFSSQNLDAFLCLSRPVGKE